MNDDDRADARTLHVTRMSRALAGQLDFDVRAAPALRGAGWGTAIAIVIAVALTAASLIGASRTPHRPTGRASDAAALFGGPAVGQWTLRRGSLNPFADSSGRHNDANVTGVVAQWRAGPRGGQVPVLDASTSVQTALPALDADGSYTVSAWLRLDAAALVRGTHTAVSQDAGGGSSFALQYRASDRRVGFEGIGTDGRTSRRALALDRMRADRWYHVVGVRDSAQRTLTLYVDGVAQSTIDAPDTTGAGGPLRLGHGRAAGRMRDTFTGALADVRVFQRALTPAQARALFRAGG